MTLPAGFDSDFDPDPDTDTDPDPDDKRKHRQLSGQGKLFSLELRAWPALGDQSPLSQFLFRST